MNSLRHNFQSLKAALDMTNNDINRFRLYKHLLLEELDNLYGTTRLPERKTMVELVNCNSREALQYKKITLFFEEHGLEGMIWKAVYASNSKVVVNISDSWKNIHNPIVRLHIFYNWGENQIDENENTETPLKVTLNEEDTVLLRTPFWEDVADLLKKKSLLKKDADSE